MRIGTPLAALAAWRPGKRRKPNEPSISKRDVKKGGAGKEEPARLMERNQQRKRSTALGWALQANREMRPVRSHAYNCPQARNRKLSLTHQT